MNNSIEIKSPDHSQLQLNFLRNSQVFQTSNVLLQTLQNQTKQREILSKCVSKIRNYTQVKNFYQVMPSQLSVINDRASKYIEIQPSKQITHQESVFETLYYQTKHQTGKLRLLILEIMRKQMTVRTRTFKPSHPLLIFWNLIKVCFMIHIFFVFPLIDAFGDKLTNFLNNQYNIFLFEWVFLVMINSIIQMVDLIIRFNVQLYKDGQLVTSNKEIALAYLKSGFLVDVCGLIGFSLFLFDDQFFTRYIYFLKFAEVRKFLKLLRREIDPQNKSKNYVQLLTLLFTIFLLAHIIACCWIAMAYADSNNWLTHRQLYDESWITIYIWSFYFAILTMTTVGYGDIVPVNQYETLACIVIVLLSSGIFAYTLSTITTILKDLDQDKSIFKQESRIIQNYMFKKGINTDLQRKVQKYLKLMWKKGLNDQLTQEMRVFQQLSPSLQQEINLQDKGALFVKVQFLVNNFSLEFLKDLMGVVKEVYYQPGEVLPSNDGLFILYKGSAELCWQTQSKMKHLCSMHQGDHFGIENLFTESSNGIQVKSKDFSIFYHISTESFKQSLKTSDYEQFCMIKDQINCGNIENLYLTCLLCRREGHHLCQDIVYKPNKQFVIEKQWVSKPQERVKFKRNEVRFSILRNFETLQRGTGRFQMEQKAYLTAKFKSVYDSMDNEDAEDPSESKSRDCSSESWRENTSNLDERHNSYRQIKQVTTNQKTAISPQIKRRSIAMPTNMMTFKPILRKGTQENSYSLLSPEEGKHPSQVFDKQTLKAATNQQGSLTNVVNEESDQNLVFDQMKLFINYFKNDNYDQVIKSFRPKKKLKKVKPILSQIV